MESEILPLRELERRAIQRALRATQGSVGKAAKLLGIGRATLYRRIAIAWDLSRDGRMTTGSSEPPLSLPPEMLEELASAGVDPSRVPDLEQWQTLLLRFAHRFRDEPSNPLQFASSQLGHELHHTPSDRGDRLRQELLLESSLDPEQRQAAQDVHRSGQELLSVIDHILSDVTEQAKSSPPRAMTPIGFRLGAENETHRVLLAEDNEFNRVLIERVLKTLNCEVDLAPTGREAVRKSVIARQVRLGAHGLPHAGSRWPRGGSADSGRGRPGSACSDLGRHCGYGAGRAPSVLASGDG